MPEEIIFYVTSYGYLAIFILVFMQEIGMPNPFPNELLLIFSGYLSFKGLLYFPLALLTALSADLLGTNVLYFLFYKTGILIMRKKPKWIPLSDSILDRLTSKISRGGLWSIYVFRITPFTRGYTSVITGLLQVKPRIFLPIAFVSALTWATIYIAIGYLIGPSWNLFTQNLGSFKYAMLAFLAIIVLMFLIIHFNRRRANCKEKTGLIN
jgi:membrane protein DedA with SNARE-associated domain